MEIRSDYMAVNPYLALKDAYLNQIKKAQTNEQNQLKQNYNADLKSANDQYDKSANNAYITYRQSQEKLPEQLSNQGLTGGASESANVRLQTAYSQNLNNNELGRQSTIDKLTSNYNNQLGDINNSYLKQIANSTADYDKLIAAWNEDERERLASGGGSGGRSSYGRSSYGGSGGYGDYSDYADYADEDYSEEIPDMLSYAKGFRGLFGKKNKGKKKSAKKSTGKKKTKGKKPLGYNYRSSIK